ncbi:unnamed protein product, partial [Didymodactylos carnosus]
DSFSIIIKSVADKITEQLIQIIESQLIQPWSTLAVSSVTDSLSKKIQNNYLVNKDQNSDSQNEDQKKYDELNKNKTNLTEEDKIFMKNYGKYRTFTEQINYNSKDYCIAYEQCEVAYYAQTFEAMQNGKQVNKEIQELADNVRNNKAASMAEISLIAKKYGIKLKVFADKNYQRTQKEIDYGVEVIYVEKGSKDDKNADQVGHAYYIDMNGNCYDVETKLNDCFYGVFSKILETKGINKSIENIRNETADDIQSNANYSKVMEAEKWIHDRHPQEANSLLFSAGRLDPSKNRYRRKQMEAGALKLSFEQKHLVEKSKHGGVTTKDLEKKTAKVLEKEGGKVELGMTESTRTTNTVLLMTPEQFHKAVKLAM